MKELLLYKCATQRKLNTDSIVRHKKISTTHASFSIIILFRFIG